MSAWVVSKEHIDALVVSALNEHENLVARTLGPNTLGALLWLECHRSVNYRYNEDTPVPAYEYATPEQGYSDAEMQKLWHCYRYQSCEHPEWEASEACRIFTATLAALDGRVGHTAWESCESVEWGI